MKPHTVRIITGWRALEIVHALQWRILGGERASYASKVIRECLKTGREYTFADLACQVVTGTHPQRSIDNPSDYADLIGDPVFRVSVSGLTINVTGNGLSDDDAIEAAVESIRRLNPYWTDDWDSLECRVVARGTLA